MNGFLWTAVAFAGASATLLGASINFGTGVAADDYSSLVSGLFGIRGCGGIAIVLATIGLVPKRSRQHMIDFKGFIPPDVGAEEHIVRRLRWR
jgi:hypothetical protein